MIFLVFKFIQDELQQLVKNKEFSEFKSAIESMLNKLTQYWSKIEKNALLCNLLDPRFKCSLMSKAQEKATIKYLEDLVTEYEEEHEISPSSQESETQPKKAKPLFVRIFNKINKSNDLNIKEVSKYLGIHCADQSVNILSWWRENEVTYPLLAKVARDYLSSSATGVASERTFSIGGLTISKTRARLHPQTVRELLTLKSWKDLP
jgi:hypothetical protein